MVGSLAGTQVVDDLTLTVTGSWMGTQPYGVTPKVMDLFGGRAWWNKTGQLDQTFQEYLPPTPHAYLHV